MSDQRKVPKAPRGLNAAGKRLWKQMHTEFDSSKEPHRRYLIERLCRNADLIDRLQSEVDHNELRVRGSQNQPVAAPELDQLRQYQALQAQLIGRLSLPTSDVEIYISGTRTEEPTLSRFHKPT